MIFVSLPIVDTFCQFPYTYYEYIFYGFVLHTFFTTLGKTLPFAFNGGK